MADTGMIVLLAVAFPFATLGAFIVGVVRGYCSARRESLDLERHVRSLGVPA